MQEKNEKIFKHLKTNDLRQPGRHKPLIINTLYNLFFNFKLYNFLVFSIYLLCSSIIFSLCIFVEWCCIFGGREKKRRLRNARKE